MAKKKNTEVDESILKTFSQYLKESESNYWTPSGLFVLDRMLGKGIPGGTFIEFYGPRSSGKTTFAQIIAGNYQKQGQIVVYMDTDSTLDPEWASLLGINIETLYIYVPDSLEDLFETTETYIKLLRQKSHDKRILLIWDTIVCSTEAELASGYSAHDMGVNPKVVTKGIKVIHTLIKKSPVTVLLLNEVRDSMGTSTFTSEEKPTGGRKLEHADVIRIRCRRKEKVIEKDSEEPLGANIELFIDKNKTGKPWRKHIFYLDFEKGIDEMKSVITMGINRGVIKLSGSWYSFREEKMGQGIENAKLFLENNPKKLNSVKVDIVKSFERK